MAADDRARERATQDAVRRILKERPPEDLPSGSVERLHQRLDEELPARALARPARTVARPTRKTIPKKRRKSVR
jgi:hypothetical protein